MKKSISKLMTIGFALAMLSPGFALATSATGYTCSNCEQAVKDQTVIDLLNTRLDIPQTQATAEQVQAINAVLSELQLKLDITQSQAVAAIINWLAAESINKYQREQQLLFMPAPGTDWALGAGAAVGKAAGLDPTEAVSPVLNSALNFSNVGLSFTYVLLTPAPQIVLNDVTYARDPNRLTTLYMQLKPFFYEGKTDGLTPYNPSQFLMSDNLVKNKMADNSTLADHGQQFIGIMTDPLPRISPQLSAELKEKAMAGEELKGSAQEAFVRYMVETAVLGVSSSAWGDIIARRTPAEGQTQSLMEIMDSHSQQRFTNPEWYSTIGSASSEAVLREIAQIQAFSVWMQFQQLRIAEQQMALMASLNTVMSKMNREISLLTAQIQMSTSQAQVQGQQLQQQLENTTKKSGE